MIAIYNSYRLLSMSFQLKKKPVGIKSKQTHLKSLGTFWFLIYFCFFWFVFMFKKQKIQEKQLQHLYIFIFKNKFQKALLK